MTDHAFRRDGRLRLSGALRSALRETRLHPAMLVAPIFVTNDPQLAGPVVGLPGVRRHLPAAAADEVFALYATGVRTVLLFGVPRARDAVASAASAADGPVPEAIRAIRQASPDIAIAADLCLCQYTASGQCFITSSSGIDLSGTHATLARMTAALADAGASLIAPSGMLDGVVRVVRTTLDSAGHGDVGILAYAVKHASALYGPFRDAARSTPSSGDRRIHQLDPANAREALREATTDVAEGADILMVKPAMTNLDTLVRLRGAFPGVPLAAYEVSGEYVQLQLAAERGWVDERAAALEMATAAARAGASLLVTYRAARLAHWMHEDLAS